MALLLVRRSFTSFCTRNLSKKTLHLSFNKQLEHQNKCIFFNKAAVRNSSNKYGVASHERYLRIQPHWLIRDKIPEGYTLIYKSPMATYFAVGSFVSTGLIAVTILYILTNEFNMDILFTSVTEDSKLLIAKSNTEVYIFCGLFVFLTVTLKLLTYRFVLRMYKRKKNYIAVFQGQLPGLKVKHSFEAGTAILVKPRFKMVQLHEESKYILGTKTAYLLDNYFRKPRDLRQMLVDYVPDEYDEEEPDN